MGSNEWIAIIGIALTFIVSAVNLYYSLRNNDRTVFVNTVSASRLKWIDSLRDKVSEFIAVSTQLAELAQRSSDIRSLTLQRDTLLHEIVLHLNPRDKEDQRLRTLADHVCKLTTSHEKASELSAALLELRDATGAYLKKEWNRVKQESAGKLD
jgi:cell shape-determining protein MreC